MVDLTPEQFADKLERHLMGTEGGWDWDDFTSIRIKDRRLDRLRLTMFQYDSLVSLTRRAEFIKIIAALRRGEIPEFEQA